MAVSKVAYNGQTLIDLTGDTATAADVATGKTFHLANGVKTTGTNTGGITPTGTINITTNGDHDVTSYANAHVAVSAGAATFAYACVLTITLDNTLEYETSFDLNVMYRGANPLDPSKVIWKTERYTFYGENGGTPAVTTVTHTINLTPMDAEGIMKDGVYIPVGDGGSTSNITSCVNCLPRFTEDNGQTGTEHVYTTITGNTASCTVYYANL